ncbi:MAG: molybdopterin molybdotransferase MoeA [Desulfitobacterium sp.]|nr:molybdopterin molybdotransferase MoeA [Desulfitobacterium sp.]
MKFNIEKSVTRQEALSLMKSHWHFTPETEIVPLAESLGRVTAQDIHSKNTLPLVRASCFDGIAIRSADFANGLPDTSGWIKGRDFVRADTGDDFPDDFDAIIAMEDIILEGNGVRFLENFTFDPNNLNVDPAGTIVKSGALLAPAHTRLTPQLLASLAMGGVAWVPVLRKMKITFIPTGSELVPPSVKPQRGQNVDTNGLMLTTLLEGWGAEVLCHPIVKDEVGRLEEALDEALACSDMVLINGGSSRGEEDLNSFLLERRGSFFRHGVKAVPGRPVSFAIVDEKPVINIPGPVIAAYLAAHWCLSALISHWFGLPALQHPKVTATLDKPLKKRPGFELIARVSLRRTADGYIATPLMWGEDGIPGLILNSDGMVNIPIDVNGLEAGETVEVELLKSTELIADK